MKTEKCQGYRWSAQRYHVGMHVQPGTDVLRQSYSKFKLSSGATLLTIKSRVLIMYNILP